ncbi:MAG: YkgJ family cysteine cluster protein [Nanoarchaeota archaeon]|nr:YkgJ family cysteine cluster protein [Nanoarchaeota archaeon]
MITCEECKGFCCTHLAVPIDKPVNLEDYKNIYWYLYHDKCSVYVDLEGIWYLQVEVPCVQLDKDGKCKIYQKRPPLCKDYGPHDCEVNEEEMLIHFKTVEDYDTYFNALVSKKRTKKQKKQRRN